MKWKIFPDIAVFAKAISNGYPMSAVIGTSDVMLAAQDSFISSTYWTERIGFVAALATIKKLKKYRVPQYLCRIGRDVQKGWRALAKKYKIKITLFGTYPLGHFSFDYEESGVLKTLFTQNMLIKGFLATNALYVSFAHKNEHVKKYLQSVNETFGFISKVLRQGNPARYLSGPVCHSGFKRLT